MDMASIANSRESQPPIQSPMDMDPCPYKPKSDFFCSDCLKSDTELRCEGCEGRFIQECAKNHTHSDNGDFKKFNVRFIPSILGFIMADEKFEPMMEMKFNEEQIRNVEVLSKMQTKSYETVKQFEDDVKWFARHCQSIDSVSEDRNNHGCNAAEKLIKNVKFQIEIIKACATCYKNLFEAFTKGSVEVQCAKRHVLLWAKAQDHHHGYWPARVLATNAKDNLVLVQYFSDYSCFWLPVKDDDFYVYSRKRPWGDKSARTELYSEAQKDAEEYILFIRLKYNFNYAEPLTAFEAGKLKKHWNKMFPEKAIRGAVYESGTSENDSSSDSECSTPEDERITNPMRKRNANCSVRNGPTGKRNRIESDADETNEADDGNIVDKFENSFREIERISLSATQGIGQLKQELEKINNEKKAAEEMNAALTAENHSLEKTIASLKESQRKAAGGQNTLKIKIAGLKESLRKQKETVDQEKMALTKKIVELRGTYFVETNLWNDEKKTLTERYAALERAKDTEKKTLEVGKKTLEELNATLIAEKDSLAQTIASLNDSHRIDKKKSNDDLNAWKKLEESQRKQKEILEQAKEALGKKNVELEGKYRTEAKMWNDKKKTLMERYTALQSVNETEKKALEADNKALVEENAALKIELDDERKKSVERKKHLEKKFEEALRDWN